MRLGDAGTHDTPPAGKPPVAGKVKPATRTRRASKTQAGTSQLTATQVKSLCAGLLVGTSALANTIAPDYWTEQDHLTEDETVRLVSALYAELENYPRAQQWLIAAATGGVHVQLALALMSVAAPRLARRGIIPDDFASFVASATTGIATGVEAGRAPSDSGADPDRQIDTGQPSIAVSGVSVSFPEQAGFDAVHSGPGHQESQPDRRHQSEPVGATS